MNAYILIIILGAGQMDTYTTLTMQRFGSLAACENARRWVTENRVRYLKTATCWPAHT